MLTANDLATLRAEIAALDAYLLASVKTVAPDTLPTDEATGIRAYLILAHAAVEEFVEAAFEQFVSEALLPDPNGRVSPGLYLTLLQFSGEIGGQLQRSRRAPMAVVKMLPGYYTTKVLNPNNGVKPANVQTLALGAGLDWPAFEVSCSGLLPTLSTLGSRRGEVAHLSAVPVTPGRGVRTTLYAADVRSIVGAVMGALPELLNHLQAQITPGGAKTQPSRVDRLKMRFKRS
jgi:hypothetical protein